MTVRALSTCRKDCGFCAAPAEARAPRHVPPPVLHFVACEDPRVLQPIPGVLDELIELPVLTLDERRGLWARLLPGNAWPPS